MVSYRQYGVRTFKESGISFELSLSMVSKAEAACVGGSDKEAVAGDIWGCGGREAIEDIGVRGNARPPAPVCGVLSSDGSAQDGEDFQGQKLQHIKERVSFPAEVAIPVDEQLFCLNGGQRVKRDNQKVY